MILHRLRVEGFRCFADPVEIGPLAEGLTILHAPNGSGKSTLFHAFRSALVDPHGVKGPEAEDALRPAGRQLAPTVQVEFSHGGTRYRVTKRWFDRPYALLERFEGERFTRFAEGDAADERVRAIVFSVPPGRGLAHKADHWGLAQVLWAPQGQLALDGLTSDAAKRISEVLGKQIGPGLVEYRVEKQYLEIFTPERGVYRTGKDAPDVVRLQSRLVPLRAARVAAKRTLEEFEAASAQVASLSVEHETARRDVQRLANEHAVAADHARTYDKLLGEKQAAEARVSAAEAQYKVAESIVEDLARLLRLLTEGRAAETQAGIDGTDLAEKAARASKALEAAEARLRDAREAAASANDALRAAGAAGELAAARATEGRVTALLSEAARLQETLATLQAAHASIAAPDTKALRAIRAAAQAIRETEAKLAAALITLEIEPETSARVTVLAGTPDGELVMRAGAPLRVSGTPEVAVHVAGLGRVQARGPGTSAAALKDQLRAAHETLARLTTRFGTSDMGALEQAHEDAAARQKAIDAERSRLEGLLGGQDVELVKRELRQAKATIARILAEHPAWRDETPDPEALRAPAIEQRAAAQSAVADAEHAEKAARAAHTAAQSAHARVTQTLVTLAAQIDTWSNEVARLASDGRSDEERVAARVRLAGELDIATVALTAVLQRFDEFTDDPRLRLAALAVELEERRRDESRTLAARHEAKGRADQLGNVGPYSALAAVEEELAQVEMDEARATQRADALKLLRTTLVACRAEAIASVAAPVQETATALLQRISGGAAGSVTIASDFAPRVAPAWADREVPIDALSGGEQEQLYLAVRLALADALAHDERQLVVLDDVLTATDPERLLRVRAVLDEYAERLQILLLTCDPGRYEHGRPHAIDLRAARAAVSVVPVADPV